MSGVRHWKRLLREVVNAHPGSVQGRAGWGSQHPGQVEGFPAHVRGVEIRLSVKVPSKPNLTFLWFCVSVIPRVISGEY